VPWAVFMLIQRPWAKSFRAFFFSLPVNCFRQDGKVHHDKQQG